jgi:SPOR domain
MTLPPTNTRVTENGRFAKVYAGVWIVLASVALAYMVAVAVQPSFIAQWLPTRSEPESNEMQRSAARFASDISGLRLSVGAIQREVASVQQTVAVTSTRENDLAARVAVLEDRTKTMLPVETAAATPAKSAAQRVAEAKAQRIAEKTPPTPTAKVPGKLTEPSDGTTTEPATSALETPATRFVVLNAPTAAQTTNPLATGSIIAPPPPAQGVPPARPVQAAATSFGPGLVKAVPTPAGPSGLEIASGPSLDALRLNWSLLSDRHAPELRNLEARYLNAGEGQPYRLVAGPVTTPDEAKRVCAQLQAKRVACRVTGFGGNAL